MFVGGCGLAFETNGLKGAHFQGDETRALSTRGVKLMCSACTALACFVWKKSPTSLLVGGGMVMSFCSVEEGGREGVLDNSTTRDKSGFVFLGGVPGRA